MSLQLLHHAPPLHSIEVGADVLHDVLHRVRPGSSVSHDDTNKAVAVEPFVRDDLDKEHDDNVAVTKPS